MAEDAKTKPLMTKAALVENIMASFDALMLKINAMSDDELMGSIGEGAWTWVDVLAHIAGWEDILVRFHIGGEPFDQVIEMPDAKYRVTSYDAVNEHLFSRYQGMSPSEAKTLLSKTHAAVLGALEKFPDEQLHQPHPVLSVGEAASVNWIDYIMANTFEHYEEHLAQG